MNTPQQLPYPRKRFGQHFLTDQNIIRKIIDSANLQKHDLVLEIGPGRGALTSHILGLVDNVFAIEFDRDLFSHLQINYPQLILYGEDALDFDYQKLLLANHINPRLPTLSKNTKFKLIGNLPYNIATELIFRFIAHLEVFSEIMIMLQKEVAERIMAKVDDKDYCRLSVNCQYFFQVDKILEVAPGAFFPPPKVRSTVIRLTPKSPAAIAICDYQIFAEIVKSAFAMRRKKLSNTLKHYFSAEQLNQLGKLHHLDSLANLRAQNVPLEVFMALANQISAKSTD